jgi:hypothetical protein
MSLFSILRVKNFYVKDCLKIKLSNACILQRRRDGNISGPAHVWRSKPKVGRRNVALLSDIYFNWKSRSVQQQYYLQAVL